jgi:hypothetical protein
MIATPLPAVEKSCGLDLEEALPAVLARRVSADQMAAFCRLYRRIGVSNLLMSGEPEAFFGYLSRGARAFAYFLEGAPPEKKKTSRSEPYFDALACGDDGAAAAIASHSRPTWNEGEEYEDDFLYPWFLMSRFTLGTRPAALDHILDRWARVLEGGEDPRLELCRALYQRDQDLFDQSLEVVLSNRQEDDRNRIEAERMPPDDVPTLAKVWVELLALLRLAESCGLRTQEHLPLAPSIARRLELARLPPPDAWSQIASYREIT